MKPSSEQCLTGAAVALAGSAPAPLRTPMHVTIKTPEEQEKMRVAGRLAAEVLDMIGEHVVPGRDHRGARPALPRLHRQRAAVDPGEPQLPRLPQDHLHLGQPRGLPRHPERQAAQGRRHRQYRRHRHQGRLPRRHQPHVLRRQAPDRTPSGWPRPASRPCGAASRWCARARTWATSATPSRASSRQQDYSVVREYCGHGIGRIYHEDPQVLHYGEPGTGLELQAGMTFTDRADGQRRQAPRAAAAGRLDRGHQGSLAVGAVGAHRAGHRHRRRSADARRARRGRTEAATA